MAGQNNQSRSPQSPNMWLQKQQSEIVDSVKGGILVESYPRVKCKSTKWKPGVAVDKEKTKTNKIRQSRRNMYKIKRRELCTL